MKELQPHHKIIKILAGMRLWAVSRHAYVKALFYARFEWRDIFCVLCAKIALNTHRNGKIIVDVCVVRYEYLVGKACDQRHNFTHMRVKSANIKIYIQNVWVTAMLHNKRKANILFLNVVQMRKFASKLDVKR